MFLQQENRDYSFLSMFSAAIMASTHTTDGRVQSPLPCVVSAWPLADRRAGPALREQAPRGWP